MAYDPSLPLENTEIDAAQMRTQLQGLKALIDAVPAGPAGPQGPQGAAGPQGEAGPPGEVTTAALDAAIAGTAANCNAVDPLSLGIGDPPTQADVQAILDKLNALITALHR